MRVEKGKFLKVGNTVLGIAPIGGEVIPSETGNELLFSGDDGIVRKIPYRGTAPTKETSSNTGIGSRLKITAVATGEAVTQFPSSIAGYFADLYKGTEAT